MAESFWRQTAAGLVIHLRVTPNAGLDRIDGPETRDDGSEVLRVRVRAVPDGGKANAAVIALVARAFDLPKNAVELTAGATARLKTLAVAGDPQDLAARAGRLGK
ncbi:MAG TPA: DUF167 family protein [Devosia sp.]|nr:DUF167 family protein [Devosia sp.]